MNISKNFIKSGIIDLAQPRLGTKILYKSDEFFGLANRIINPNFARNFQFIVFF